MPEMGTISKSNPDAPKTDLLGRALIQITKAKQPSANQGTQNPTQVLNLIGRALVAIQANPLANTNGSPILLSVPNLNKVTNTGTETIEGSGTRLGGILAGTVTPTQRLRPELRCIALADVMHPKALLDLLKTIDSLIKISRGETIKSYRRDLSSEEILEAYNQIEEVWHNAEVSQFVNDRELLKQISSKLGLNIDRAIFEARLAPHQLTGFESKYKAVNLALAHAYALSTGSHFSVVFGDVANVGGTNQFYREILSSALLIDQGHFDRNIWLNLGFTEAELQEIEESPRSKADFNEEILHRSKAAINKAASRLTDWSTQALMSKVKDTLKAELSAEEYKQIEFIGAGGDEYFMTIPKDPRVLTRIFNIASTLIDEARVELGLNFHAHLKEGKAFGMDLSFAIHSLQNDLTALSQKPDSTELVNSTAPFATEGVDHINRARLLQTMDVLRSTYAHLNPTREKSYAPIMGAFDENQINNPEYQIRYQLFNVYNSASDTYDIEALAESFNPDIHNRIIGIALSNLAAINDNLNQDIANDYQRRFTAALRAMPDLTNLEIFSAGPGRFFLLTDSVISREDLNQRVNELVNSFNQEEINGSRIGALSNKKNSILKGLTTQTVLVGIDPAEDINLTRKETQAMLETQIDLSKRTS